MASNRVRIIGGQWRSRWIQFPDAEICVLRPIAYARRYSTGSVRI
jgi:hypothetical protein